MPISKSQLQQLLGMIAETHDRELSCDDCFALLDAYVEHQLAEQPTPAALRTVRGHLDFCGECQEEYDTLLAALSSLSDS